MIDARQLRIGNKVQRISNGNICTVNWGIIKDADSAEGRDYQPIPLTPTVLEQCGFSNHDRTISLNDSGYDPKIFYYILDGYDEFSQRKFRYNFIIGGFNDGLYYQANYRRSKGMKIEYVHQLQNLYFALTGEELTINQLTNNKKPEDKPVFFKDAFRTPPPHPPKAPV